MERRRQSYRTKLTGWLVKAPHKIPVRLRDLAANALKTSLLCAAGPHVHPGTKEFAAMCELLRLTLPVEVRSAVVAAVVSMVEISDARMWVWCAVLQLLCDVQHLALAADLDDTWLDVDDGWCNVVAKALVGLGRRGLESLTQEGVTLAPGLLTAIIEASPRLTAIHVGGDDAAAEVLACLARSPMRHLLVLHLDTCNATDLEVVSALVRRPGEDTGAQYEADSDNDFPQLRHLSVESPRLTLCGALVLLQSLPNLRQLHYSHWNSSLCNLLSYVHQQAPTAKPFALTTLSLWRLGPKALDTLRLCPDLTTLMMECTDPTLPSLTPLAAMRSLTSLTLRMVEERLVISAVKAVGAQLHVLEVESEEYNRTPIACTTLRAVQEYCHHLRRLHLHHLTVQAASGDLVAMGPSVVLPELVHLDLTGVILPPQLLQRIISGNAILETITLDVNQDALTDSVLTKLLANNNLRALNHVFLSTGLLTAWGLAPLLTLPALARLSIHLPNFPLIPKPNFIVLQYKLLQGNYQCTVEDSSMDD